MSLRQATKPPIVSRELHSGANTRVPERWLLLAWVPLLVVTVLNLIIYVVGTPAYLAWFHSLHTTNCFDGCLTPADVQSLHALGIPITTYAVYWVTIDLLFALVYFAVAALIFWRKSDDWMALFASFSLVAYGASFPSIPGAFAAAHPAWALPVTFVSEDVLGFPSLFVFLFLFPNGRFVPRWTRWVAVGLTALFVLGAFFPDSPFNFLHWPVLLALPVPLVAIGSIVFAQVYRYRHVSTSIERQQTKWIVLGTAIGLLGFLLLGYLLPRLLQLFIPLQHVGLLPSVIVLTSIYLLLLLIPLSLAIAILRYRLWDVDVFINRTLVYSLLTGTLIAVYAGCVVGLQALLQGIFHQTSEVTIVVSTLIIVAISQPLRKLIQQIIDRRFYRSKYDAARTVAAFTIQLSRSEEVDLETLQDDLLVVVQETMQPAHISLWLCPTDQDTKSNS